MTIALKRRSPATLKGRPLKTEIRDGWHIVSRYEGDGKGLNIIDLSHFPRWDIQDKTLEQVRPYGHLIPAKPGQLFMDKNLLIGRLNATQAIAWHFSPQSPVFPKAYAFTDITDAAVAMALAGPDVFEMSEKLCALDLSNFQKDPPFLVQGPFSHVPCHIWVLNRNSSGGCIALTCSRGYALNMIHAVLEAGKQWGISPQGEDRFRSFLGW